MKVRGLIRSRWLRVIGAAVAALLLYLALAVFGVQTLFYDKEVNEDLTTAAPVVEEQAAREGAAYTPSEDVAVPASARSGFPPESSMRLRIRGQATLSCTAWRTAPKCYA